MSVLWDTVRRDECIDPDESCRDPRIIATRTRRAADARALAETIARQRGPAVVPLTVREQRHRSGQTAWFVVGIALALLASVLWMGGWLDGRPNVFDAAPMGGKR